MSDKTLDSLAFVAKIATFRKLMEVATKYKHQYGHFEIKSAHRGNIPKVFMENVDAISSALAKYGHWKESGFKLADDPDAVRDAVKKVLIVQSDTYQSIREDNVVIDPYTLFDNAPITEQFNKVSTLWMTFELVPGDVVTDSLKRSFFTALKCVTSTFITMLDKLDCMVELIEADPDLGVDIRTMFDGRSDNIEQLDVVKHEEVVYLTPAEREMQARAEARKQEEERQEALRLDMLNAVKEKASVIKQCYDQHKKAGTLSRFCIRQEILEALADNSKLINCTEKIEALWSLLMSMSNSVRFMPGEKGEPFERIMGSIMELEKEVCTYKSRFLMSTGEFDLTHNKIVDALTTIAWVSEDGSQSGPIQAQYIDTKKYIDQTVDKDRDEQTMIPRSFHLFC